MPTYVADKHECLQMNLTLALGYLVGSLNVGAFDRQHDGANNFDAMRLDDL